MSNAVMFISFKLVDGASVQDFLLAAEKLNGSFLSKQKGYISWKQLVDKDLWVDFITWETMEDAQNAMKASEMDAGTPEYMAFIDGESVKYHLFVVERSY